MASSKPRLIWFDANRVFAAFGVVLIHSTTDFAGSAFPDASVPERGVPVFLRSIGEFSGSEMFFLFSLFLMAMRVDRGRPAYGAAISMQAERLLVPFAFWTVFYAFFTLLKANAFDYAPQYWDQLTHGSTWLNFFILGGSQYHMHFLPTLFLLFLFYPVMRLAVRYPVLGLTLFGTLGAMEHVQGYFYALPISAEVLPYLIRATKVMGYVGYGFAAFAFYSLWKGGIPRGESRLIQRGAIYFAAMAYVATLPYFGTALFTGEWGLRADWSYFGHFLMPVFMFCLFLGGQHFEWSPRWSELAKYTFGVYLLHPILIDLFDIAIMHFGMASGMSPAAIVLLRYAIVLPATFALTVGMSRLKLSAWTIGLGPAPWKWAKSPPKVTG